MKDIKSNILQLIQTIEEGEVRKELLDTPRRVQKAYEEWFSGYSIDTKSLFTVFEEDGVDQIVALRNIEFWSMCEHHMAPFYGTAAVAYLPSNKVIGASKLGRLVQAYARRLQIQERIGRQVAEDIMQFLKPRGVAVIIKGNHLCMRSRGLNSQSSELVTSIMLGAFRTEASARNEVLALLRS